MVPSIVLRLLSRRGLVFTGPVTTTRARGRDVRAVVVNTGMLEAVRHVAARSTGIMIRLWTFPDLKQVTVLLKCGWLRLRAVRVMNVLSWRFICWVSRL